MGLVLAKFALVGLTSGRGANSKRESMALPRPIRPQYIPSQEELMSEALQNKRKVVQRFAEIILMNDEGNTIPAHQIAGKAVELYNKIEDYL